MRAVFFAFVPLLGLLACESSEPPSCPVGRAGCECTVEGLCIEGLSCVDNECQAGIAEESGTSESETTLGTTTTADATGTTETSESSETVSSSDGPCTAPEIECDGACVNPLTDDLNCGECGHACIIEGGVGACIEGSCTPRLSECIDWGNPIPCNEVCAQIEATCVATGCLGGTYVTYNIIEDCLAHDPNGVLADPCTEPDIPSNGAYRCCCSQ